MSVRPDLDAEITRLTDEIAAKKAAAARLRAGLSATLEAPKTSVLADAGSATKQAADREATLAPTAHDPVQLSDIVRETIPPDGKPLVLRGGHHALAAIAPCEPIPFPPPLAVRGDEQAEGTMAAIAALEALRSRGATHLVLPPDSEDWLARTRGFMVHVTNRYRKLAGHEGWSIHSLDFDPGEHRPWTHHLTEIFEEYRARHGGELAALDWTTELGLAGRRWRGCTVFQPPTDDESLPYLSDSIEMVALGAGATTRMLEEGRRVAANAVLRPSEPQGPIDYFEVEWMREPDRARPPTSIIVPTYNAAAILDTCLRALEETLSPAIPVEVVVVDDASSDETGAVLERWGEQAKWLRAVRNDENRGFLESCNAGAAAASGELLVFLNNDTIPLPGWLLPLVETLVDTPDAGAVGGRLLYPDGSLQEAGGVIFSDAGGANVGRDDPNPDHPLYSFLRDVHYCSGALLATRAELFADLGGFDAHFNPGYYEETDYCFRLRRHGARVLFEPECAIVHLEGATAGTDEASGMKRYQAINREKFRERWAEELASCPPPPVHWDELTWHRLARAMTDRVGA